MKTKKKHYLFSIDEDLREQFKRICEEAGVTMSDVIAAAMIDHVLAGTILEENIEKLKAQWVLKDK